MYPRPPMINTDGLSAMSSSVLKVRNGGGGPLFCRMGDGMRVGGVGRRGVGGLIK